MTLPPTPPATNEWSLDDWLDKVKEVRAEESAAKGPSGEIDTLIDEMSMARARKLLQELTDRRRILDTEHASRVAALNFLRSKIAYASGNKL